MRKLLELVAVIALLNVLAFEALADGPALSAQPDVRPDTQGSTVGGSASATGGNAGPATVASSEPATASSSNTAAPGSTARGSTTATGPGTEASVPVGGSASEPNPSAPDGSTPTTSGPAADADASRTNVTASDSRVRANADADATAAFAGAVTGIGSAEDPTRASTCSTAEASPGVPTDASLGTSCGRGPSSASEDFSANSSDGNGASGTPSGSACFLADASAGPSPTADVNHSCGEQGATPPSGSSAGSANGSGNATPTTRSNTNGESFAATLLGIESLPSTATGAEPAMLLGTTLAGAGLVLLRRSRPKS